MLSVFSEEPRAFHVIAHKALEASGGGFYTTSASLMAPTLNLQTRWCLCVHGRYEKTLPHSFYKCQRNYIRANYRSNILVVTLAPSEFVVDNFGILYDLANRVSSSIDTIMPANKLRSIFNRIKYRFGG